MKRLSFLINALFLFTSAHAQELMLITENAPPNSYIENGRLTGLSVEIVRAVMDEIDLDGKKIKVYPWVRGYRMLQTDKNTALFATSRTEQRERIFKWAGPIADNEVNFYKLKTRVDIQPKTIEDLKQYKVGGAKEDQKSQYLTSVGIDYSPVNHDSQNIYRLLAGRVDIIPYAALRLKYDLKKNGIDPDQLVKIWRVPEISSQVYIAFSQSTDDRIVGKFQKGFDVIKRKGIHKEIMNNWIKRIDDIKAVSH